MGINKEQVEKALADLEGNLKPEEEVNKASEQDLDNPEGDDLGGGHMGNKMSDSAPSPSKSPLGAKKKAKKSEEGEDEMGKAVKALFKSAIVCWEEIPNPSP